MAQEKPAKLAQLANRIFNVDYHDYTQTEMALKSSAQLKLFFISLNLKTTLRELNIDDSAFEKMAIRATNNDKTATGYYIPLHKKEFIEIPPFVYDPRQPVLKPKSHASSNDETSFFNEK